MRSRIHGLTRRARAVALVASVLFAASALPSTAFAAISESADELEDPAPITVCELAEPAAGDAELMASSADPIYDYQVYYLDGLGDTWYNNGNVMRYLYIRTDNPEADFTLDFDKSTQGTVAAIQRGAFADVDD